MGCRITEAKKMKLGGSGGGSGRYQSISDKEELEGLQEALQTANEHRDEQGAANIRTEIRAVRNRIEERQKMKKDAWGSDVQKDIQTVQGQARYVRTEVEDKSGRWNDDYATRDGYYVIHEGNKHHVYKVR